MLVVAGMLAADHVSRSALIRREPAVHAYASWDTSGASSGAGFRGDLGKSVSTFCAVLPHLVRGKDSLTCFRTDRSTESWFDSGVPVSAVRFGDAAADELSRPPRADGTDTAGFFARVAPAVSADHSGCPVVVFFGDCDQDVDPAKADGVLRAAARRIAANPRAIVIIAGISAANWDRIEDAFAPLQGRLHMETASAMSAADIVRWIGAARAGRNGR